MRSLLLTPRFQLVRQTSKELIGEVSEKMRMITFSDVELLQMARDEESKETKEKLAKLREWVVSEAIEKALASRGKNERNKEESGTDFYFEDVEVPEKEIKEHNKRVEEAFKRARNGETICLTDLMISKEKLIEKALDLKGRKNR